MTSFLIFLFAIDNKWRKAIPLCESREIAFNISLTVPRHPIIIGANKFVAGNQHISEQPHKIAKLLFDGIGVRFGSSSSTHVPLDLPVSKLRSSSMNWHGVFHVAPNI